MLRFVFVLLLTTNVSSVIAADCVKPSIPAYSFTGFYSDISDDLNGEALKSALNETIRNQTRLLYRCVWEAVSEADQDPDDSGNVILIYTRRSIPKTSRASGDHQNQKNYWNREHVWPSSHGVKNTAAHTDLHHVFAADATVNSSRGDKDFDEGGNAHHECEECRTDGDSWEPPDDIKGDLARVLFYMAVRYEGNDSSGADDLELVNRVTDSRTPFLGVLSTLLE
jgi:serine protease